MTELARGAVWNGAETRPLGEILVQSGVLAPTDLARALEHQRRQGLKLGQAVVALGLATEWQIAEALGSQGRIPAVRLSPALVEPGIAEELGAEVSRRLGAIAINRIAGITTVAMEDPGDVDHVDEIGRRLGGPFLAVHAGPIALRECLDHFFPRGVDRGPDLGAVVAGIDPESLALSTEHAAPALGDDDESPVVRLVEGIILDACEARASDVHFEPRADAMVVRFRVDGVLYERLRLPKSWLRPCLSRLKILAELDITQRRLPQDGRILARIRDRRVDLRVATTGTLQGEGAAVRIFDGGRQVIGLETLGFDDRQLAALHAAFASRDGFILATGPSGSGKTTTLYSILRELNSEDRKIVTLEDPVESELEEAVQIAANPQIGLDFERGLRSILRLDPDVIMIGEIRDRHTAQTAVTASLTGHLVLSSLATVGAAETIMRLVDLGVDRFLVADTMRAIVSQRLVRRICRACRAPAEAPRRLRDAMGIANDPGPFFAGRGCEECRHTGFRGRIALSEVMTMTPELYPLVSGRTSSGEIRQAAVAGGMRTMRQDGLAKVRAGQTTLEEVYAVCGGRIAP
ncbi:MAG: GspE/PulE family protein [Planctomycetota bacterium]